MQQGLNIGIGSWIDAQYQNRALPAFPSTAIPFKLSHLSSLKTPEDLIRAMELSLLANRTDSSGSQYGIGEISSYLWTLHQNIITLMIPAISRLTAQERDELVRADSILFGNDGISPSDIYHVFEETRRNYQDLVVQNAEQDDITDAYNNWLVFGHKAEIEEAIATKLRLTRSSTNVAAQSDVSKINMALSSSGADIPFAPTYFSPLSALSTEHWLEAKVDFQALEDTIKPHVPRNQWKQFRANKAGSVKFRYIGVDLMRPWLNEEIYAADDWRLPPNESELIASGNGLSGKMPWIFSKIYMAQILDIRNHTVSISNPIQIKPVINPIRILPALKNVHYLGNRKRSVDLNSGLGRRREIKGVIRSPLRLQKSALAMVSIVRPATENIQFKPSIFKAAITSGRIGRITKIQKIDKLTIKYKLDFTLAQLHRTSISQPQDTTTYIVGFGRKNLPFCPNPNSNYQWP